MVFPKKLVASIAVFISLGFIYSRVSTAVAFENTSSASFYLLPEMRFRFGRLLLEWYLSRLLLYYLLRRKYKKSFESMRYAFKRFFYGRLR